MRRLARKKSNAEDMWSSTPTSWADVSSGCLKGSMRIFLENFLKIVDAASLLKSRYRLLVESGGSALTLAVFQSRSASGTHPNVTHSSSNTCSASAFNAPPDISWSIVGHMNTCPFGTPGKIRSST